MTTPVTRTVAGRSSAYTGLHAAEGASVAQVGAAGIYVPPPGVTVVPSTCLCTLGVPNASAAGGYHYIPQSFSTDLNAGSGPGTVGFNTVLTPFMLERPGKLNALSIRSTAFAGGASSGSQTLRWAIHKYNPDNPGTTIVVQAFANTTMTVATGLQSPTIPSNQQPLLAVDTIYLLALDAGTGGISAFGSPSTYVRNGLPITCATDPPVLADFTTWSAGGMSATSGSDPASPLTIASYNASTPQYIAQFSYT